MVAIYEFHVAGQVGAVIRTALPEMQTFEQRSGSTLRGMATGRREIDRLLELIQTMNMIVERLHIEAHREQSVVGDDVPVVDDGRAQGDILQ